MDLKAEFKKHLCLSSSELLGGGKAGEAEE